MILSLWKNPPLENNGKPDLRVDRDGGTPSRGAIVYGTTDEGGEIMFVNFYVIEDSGDPVPLYDVYRLTHEGGLKMARLSGLVLYNAQ